MSVYALALHETGNCWPPNCPVCAQEPDDDEPMPDPDTLTHTDATCWANLCRAVARAIRHELPYASAERIAEDLDQRAGSYQDRADDTKDTA